MRERVQNRVLELLDISKEVDDAKVYDAIDFAILEISREEYISISQRENLRTSIFNTLRRLDVLQELLEDDSITEIMVNGYNCIYVERKGRLSKWERGFLNQDRYLDVLQQIVTTTNRRVNTSSPIVDARLEDGSRVHIVLNPISIDGAALTIRKFYRGGMTMQMLLDNKSLSEEISVFLSYLVKAKYNILISGGTGSGKTTFLNILSGFIEDDERIITIEDSAELQIMGKDNLIRLETRNANVEGENEISMQELIRASLRMRPDRILVGEVRGREAIEMLQAMNTGHEGSISTCHANSAYDAISRIETMVLMGVKMPLDAIRRQIYSAIDFIIHLGRMRDGTRKILEIAEIYKKPEQGKELHILYQFEEFETEEGKVDGRWVKKGNLISTEKLAKAGIIKTYREFIREREEYNG
ncbi:MAG: CpaF family protein [Lachnospiraceae bacterium]